jgi:hypothetical protein
MTPPWVYNGRAMRTLAGPLGVILVVLGFSLLVFARRALAIERRLTGVTDEDLRNALVFTESTRLWINRFGGVGLILIGALWVAAGIFGQP